VTTGGRTGGRRRWSGGGRWLDIDALPGVRRRLWHAHHDYERPGPIRQKFSKEVFDFLAEIVGARKTVLPLVVFGRWVCVSYELDTTVATISPTTAPAALNAINGRVCARISNDAFARFRDEEDAWVAIVTRDGRAFCVGADLKDGADRSCVPGDVLGEADDELPSRVVGDLQALIAAVNGYAWATG